MQLKNENGLESRCYSLEDIRVSLLFKSLFVKSLKTAARYGNLEIIKYVYAQLPNDIDFKQLYQTAVKYGHLHIVHYIMRHAKPDKNNWKLESIIGSPTNRAVSSLYGNIPIIKWIYQRFVMNGYGNHGDTTNKNLMDYAAINGHLPMLQWLHVNRNEGCTKMAMDLASMNGDLPTVQFLHENRSEGCTSDALNFASENGHFQVVQFLHANRSEGCSTHALDNAAKNGHFKIVQFLHANRSEGCSTLAIDQAAKNGHFKIVKFLHFQRLEGCTTDAIDLACEKETNFPIIEFLHYSRTEGSTPNAMDIAASNGCFNILKFLLQNRTEGCTDMILHDAIQCGDLEVIKFIQENINLSTTSFEEDGDDHGDTQYSQQDMSGGSGADSSIQQQQPSSTKFNTLDKPNLLDRAAFFGHFHIFKHLYDTTNEQYTFESMDNFARFNDVAPLEWIKKEWSRDEDCCSIQALKNAIENNNNLVIRWLIDNGYVDFEEDGEEDYILDFAAKHGNLEVVRHFHHLNKSATKAAMDKSSNISVVEFLHFNRSEGCSTKAIDRSIKKANFPIIKFLHENRTEVCSSKSNQCYNYPSRLKFIKKHLI
ncbi:hypothetical protein PPL_11418 [Heterostelium album PN500]|uniref:Ankyrin repeat protein n=1 Tax=Heterostelium pallidum (strain ATCC 26659 / Pp 5 / PN500) TaxID=670386 RepID=D3BTC5_HETP5|nr:hypothetical protein PPL_11418 [Heterostelium album PN500]EFA75342.1 hypothetical protein PPL_11418 [Heterostelium album PN500]|eukprot:XP_020427476.1 hypothetical protein PPL_11418 [Heterostelium album PN500]